MCIVAPDPSMPSEVEARTFLIARKSVRPSTSLGMDGVLIAAGPVS
jgi:hypothetical protein